MNIQKTWFSYWAWGILSICSLMAISFFTGQISVLKNEYPSYIVWGIRVILIFVPCLICFLLHMMIKKRKLKNTFQLEGKKAVVLNVILFIVMLCVFFLFRIYNYQKITDFSFVKENIFYCAALINNNKISMVGSHPILFYSYRMFLRSIFLVFGNKEAVFIGIQFVLQLVSVIALFFSGKIIFRHWIGTLPAFAISMIPLSVNAIFTLDYSNFTLMLFSIWMLVFSLVFRTDNRNYIKPVVLGLISGIICAYWYGFICLLLLLIAYDLEDSLNSIQQRVITAFITLITAGAVFGLVYYFCPFSFALTNILDFNRVGQIENLSFLLFAVSLMLYSTAFWFSEFDKGHLFAFSVIVCIVLMFYSNAFSSVIELGFFLVPLVFWIISETLFQLFGMEVMDESFKVTEEDEFDILLRKPIVEEDNNAASDKASSDKASSDKASSDKASVNKDLGNKDSNDNDLSSVKNNREVVSEKNSKSLYTNEKDLFIDKKDETNSKKELKTDGIQNSTKAITDSSKEDYSGEEVIRVSDILKNKDSAKGIYRDDKAFIDKEKTVVNKRDFIENVLPMPKKHVSKNLDYDYPVAPNEMHFDLELGYHNSHYDV